MENTQDPKKSHDDLGIGYCRRTSGAGRAVESSHRSERNTGEDAKIGR